MASNITLSGLKVAILFLHLFLTVHATFSDLGSVDIRSGLKQTTVPLSSLGPLLIARPGIFVSQQPLAGVPGPVSRLWPMLGQNRDIHLGSAPFGFSSGSKTFETPFLGQKVNFLSLSIFPVGIWRQNDVVLTSVRRNHVASTLIRRHFTLCARWIIITVVKF